MNASHSFWKFLETQLATEFTVENDYKADFWEFQRPPPMPVTFEKIYLFICVYIYMFVWMKRAAMQSEATVV